VCSLVASGTELGVVGHGRGTVHTFLTSCFHKIAFLIYNVDSFVSNRFRTGLQFLFFAVMETKSSLNNKTWDPGLISFTLVGSMRSSQRNLVNPTRSTRSCFYINAANFNRSHPQPEPTR